MQEQTASPSTSTVPAPQSPASQPTLVPVSPRFSRRTLDKRRAGEVETFTARPFTLKAIATPALLVSTADRALTVGPPRTHAKPGELASGWRRAGRLRSRAHRQWVRGMR